MTSPDVASNRLHKSVVTAVAAKPIFAVVRTDSYLEAARQARLFADSGLELIEVTYSVPGALDLTRELLRERAGPGPPFFGMGTVTTAQRAMSAVAVGAEFVVTPNSTARVASIVKEAGLYLVLGSFTATEIVEAAELGADLVKVYPLPPIGGARYLATVRQPLGDIPMLAGGGFEVDEIPAYRAAGASAFGIGAPLLGTDDEATKERIQRALRLATSESEP